MPASGNCIEGEQLLHKSEDSCSGKGAKGAGQNRNTEEMSGEAGDIQQGLS